MFRIPTVPTAQEVLDRAFNKAKKAKGKGRGALERSKALSLSRVDAFAETIRSSLMRVYKSFPTMENLSPFYWELIDVLVGVDAVKKNLGSVRWAYLKVGDVARGSRTAIRRSTSVDGIERARKGCYGRVSSLLSEIDSSLRFLNDVRNQLRSLPTVDPSLPTLVVAGSPNVGKSQLVRAMSSGRPRVASYPFTTLDLSLGHFEVSGARYQVLDTPGLLDRPLHERNEVERKALVALRHLADVIVFLFDPTEICGYPLKDQEALLEDLKATFGETPIVEVDNKADLPGGRGSRMQVSALTGAGVDTLVRQVVEILTSRVPEVEPPRGAG